MITFDDITVTFGDFVALPTFDLTIEEGEFFTFLGPSGCGKTTALRTLAGFVEPSAGRIRIGTRDVTHLPSSQRDLGMVFQNYALFPSMSVRDNIAFGLKVARAPRAEIEAKVTEIAREVNLTDEQLDKGVAELSGGQQQRVAIARALVLRPRILLLDEPLSNLDAKLRKQLRVQLKELQRQFGITSVYVTHDQDEALSMSDRIAVINQGRIEQVGTPEEIYTRSATEFVCTFIGEANIFHPAQTRQIHARRADIDPDRTAYLRVEKLELGPGRSDHLRLPGRVLSRRYHGTHASYQVQVGESVVSAMVSQSAGAPSYADGDDVEVSFDPADLLQYSGSRDA